MTDEQLTAIYNEANGIYGGKNPPITTRRIFAAMRLVAEKEREKIATWYDKEGQKMNNRRVVEAIRSMT